MKNKIASLSKRIIGVILASTLVFSVVSVLTTDDVQAATKRLTLGKTSKITVKTGIPYDCSINLPSKGGLKVRAKASGEDFTVSILNSRGSIIDTLYSGSELSDGKVVEGLSKGTYKLRFRYTQNKDGENVFKSMNCNVSVNFVPRLTWVDIEDTLKITEKDTDINGYITYEIKAQELNKNSYYIIEVQEKTGLKRYNLYNNKKLFIDESKLYSLHADAYRAYVTLVQKVGSKKYYSEKVGILADSGRVNGF